MEDNEYNFPETYDDYAVGDRVTVLTEHGDTGTIIDIIEKPTDKLFGISLDLSNVVVVCKPRDFI